MGSLERSMEDGFSSAGTAGQGLGAIARQSTSFEIYTRPGAGTAVIATIGAASRETQPFEIGIVCRPVKGEVECGDGWALGRFPNRSTFMLADGLGHGTSAYAAASQAMKVFGKAAENGPTEVLEVAHVALRPTRGAAVAVADMNYETGRRKVCRRGQCRGSNSYQWDLAKPGLAQRNRRRRDAQGAGIHLSVESRVDAGHELGRDRNAVATR